MQIQTHSYLTSFFVQVIEKDAETDRKKAVIEAEKEAQVAKIRLAHTFCVCICCIRVFVSCICLRILSIDIDLGDGSMSDLQIIVVEYSWLAQVRAEHS